jgi:hypothetical protein
MGPFHKRGLSFLYIYLQFLIESNIIQRANSDVHSIH